MRRGAAPQSAAARRQPSTACARDARSRVAGNGVPPRRSRGQTAGASRSKNRHRARRPQSIYFYLQDITILGCNCALSPASVDGPVLSCSGSTTRMAQDDGKSSARRRFGCWASTTRSLSVGGGLCLATRRLLSIAGLSALAEPARQWVLLLTVRLAPSPTPHPNPLRCPMRGCRLCRQARWWTYERPAVLCIQACGYAGLRYPHPSGRGFRHVSCPSKRPSDSVWHSIGVDPRVLASSFWLWAAGLRRFQPRRLPPLF